MGNVRISEGGGGGFMNFRAFRAAFPQTVPVMAGYLALGVAYGLLMSSAGLSVWWTLLMSSIIYAGSGQFLAVSLLTGGASLAQAALLTLVLHFRHLFYGLSLISRFQGTGWRKPYLIFGLTDETYALLTAAPVPAEIPPQDFCFAVTLLDQLYWVTGSVLGSTIGTFITFNTAGVDFAMTALFVVLLVDQVKKQEDRIPAAIGLGCALLSLVLFGGGSFLIPALAAITVLLLAGRGKMERRVSPP